MKKLWVVLFLFASFTTYAQEWLTYDVRSITIKEEIWGPESSISIFSNGEKISHYLYDNRYKEYYKKVEQRLRARLSSYKSNYPNGKVAFHFNAAGNLAFDDDESVGSVLKLSSTGNSVRSSDLQARIAELEAQNDELEKEVIRLSADLENAERSKEEKSDLLLACVESNRTLELENSDLRSSQEALDVAVNAHGRKRFIKEYNQIKTIISTVKAEYL